MKKIFQVFDTLLALRATYNGLLLGTGANKVVFNPLPWDVRTVIFNKPDTGDLVAGENTQQIDLQTSVEDEGEGRFRVPSKFTAALGKNSTNEFMNLGLTIIVYILL